MILDEVVKLTEVEEEDIVIAELTEQISEQLITEAFYKYNVENIGRITLHDNTLGYAKNIITISLKDALKFMMSGMRESKVPTVYPYFAVDVKLDDLTPFSLMGKENEATYEYVKKLSGGVAEIPASLYKVGSRMVDKKMYNLLFLLRHQTIYYSPDMTYALVKEFMKKHLEAQVNKKPILTPINVFPAISNFPLAIKWRQVLYHSKMCNTWSYFNASTNSGTYEIVTNLFFAGKKVDDRLIPIYMLVAPSEDAIKELRMRIYAGADAFAGTKLLVNVEFVNSLKSGNGFDYRTFEEEILNVFKARGVETVYVPSRDMHKGAFEFFGEEEKFNSLEQKQNWSRELAEGYINEQRKMYGYNPIKSAKFVDDTGKVIEG